MNIPSIFFSSIILFFSFTHVRHWTSMSISFIIIQSNFSHLKLGPRSFSLTDLFIASTSLLFSFIDVKTFFSFLYCSTNVIPTATSSDLCSKFTTTQVNQNVVRYGAVYCSIRWIYETITPLYGGKTLRNATVFPRKSTVSNTAVLFHPVIRCK